MSSFKVFACLAALLISGCANTLYQGDFQATDTAGKERNFILYWTKTDPLIGKSKAGPAVLLTECSPARIHFSDSKEGILFRGEPGADRLQGQDQTVGQDEVCGKIEKFQALKEIPEGTIALRMFCEPLPADEFAVQPRNYLAPRSEPYSIAIAEQQKDWSLLGKVLEGPQAPACGN